MIIEIVFVSITSPLTYNYLPLILCPSKRPWFSLSFYSISYHLSFSCSCNKPSYICLAAIVFHLSTLSHSNITSWTDCSVPGRLVERGAENYIKCAKCFTAASLSLAEHWATSYSTTTYVILHPLKWCISHFLSSNFITLSYSSTLNLFCQLSLLPCHT